MQSDLDRLWPRGAATVWRCSADVIQHQFLVGNRTGSDPGQDRPSRCRRRGGAASVLDESAITKNGVIHGGRSGVSVRGLNGQIGTLQVANTGLIEAATFSAVKVLDTLLKRHNSGETHEAVCGVSASGAAPPVIRNTGLIGGQGGALFLGSGNATVSNGGVLAGAVLLGPGNDRLDGGAGGDGDDVLSGGAGRGGAGSVRLWPGTWPRSGDRFRRRSGQAGLAGLAGTGAGSRICWPWKARQVRGSTLAPGSTGRSRRHP